MEELMITIDVEVSARDATPFRFVAGRGQCSMPVCSSLVARSWSEDSKPSRRLGNVLSQGSR